MFRNERHLNTAFTVIVAWYLTRRNSTNHLSTGNETLLSFFNDDVRTRGRNLKKKEKQINRSAIIEGLYNNQILVSSTRAQLDRMSKV